jgi:hypothetical protein
VKALSTGSLRTRVPSVVLLAVLSLLVAGVAAAYWHVTGAGSAAAATGTTSPLTLSPGSASAQLYPGGQASVVLTVSNPNAGGVKVGSLALDTTQGASGFAVDAAHAGCALAALSFATQTNGGAGWTVPAGSALAVTLTNALSMTASAANACQGATFTVYLRVAS